MDAGRQALLEILGRHSAADATEERHLRSMIAFVGAEPDCFQRSLLKGHITASALIVDRERAHTLLMFHRKLEKWLQPGGHADGETDVLQVALKEAREETGLSEFQVVMEDPFDVDVHPIPARGDVPKHLHYDLRYLLEADRKASLLPNHESLQVEWIPLKEIAQYNSEESVLRMVRKASEM